MKEHKVSNKEARGQATFITISESETHGHRQKMLRSTVEGTHRDVLEPGFGPESGRYHKAPEDLRKDRTTADSAH